MRVSFYKLLGFLLIGLLAGLVRPVAADFPVASSGSAETFPAVARNSRTGEFLVAYRVPWINGMRLLLSRFDAQANLLENILPPLHPSVPPPPPPPPGISLSAIGRPAIAYSHAADRFLVAVPHRIIVSGYDLVSFWLLEGNGGLVTYGLLFAEDLPLYYPSPPGTSDEVGEHSALRVVHNEVLDEFVVTFQRSTDPPGEPRWNGLWALRVRAADGSLNGNAKRLINFQEGGVHSHTLAHAQVQTAPAGGVYLLAASPFVEHSHGPRLLDHNLDPIFTHDTTGDGSANFPLIPLNYGYPEEGLKITNLQAAYGVVEGQPRFLLIWEDKDNCRPGPVDSCTPNTWTGIWGTYIDPQRRLYPPLPNVRENTPFPISRIGYHAFNKRQLTPRLSYNPSTRGFAVVWRELPTQNPANDESRSHIRGVWVDYFVPDGLYGTTLVPLPPANVVISDVTGPDCSAGVQCRSKEDPVLPAVAPLGASGAVVVWQQHDPANASNLDIQGDILALPPPLNDDCANAFDIGTGQHGGTLLGASNDGDASCAHAGQPDAWYRYTAPQAGELVVDTCGTRASSGMDTVLSLHADSCPADAANEWDCNDDSSVTPDPPVGCAQLDSVVRRYLAAGESALVRVSRFFDGTSPSEFTLNLAFSLDEDNDGYPQTEDCDDRDSNSYPGATEICDNKDNDCDLAVDEDITPVPTSCGLGECAAAGSETCVSGQLVDNCSPGSPVAEICDGFDNDCDGIEDDNIDPVTISCGIGDCQAAGTRTCTGGQLVDNCIPGIPGVEACDGRDNDCDGTIDDNIAPIIEECGVGVCSAVASLICTDGQYAGVCTPGDPGVEICDGFDNDCDAEVDEALGTTTCGVGVCEHTVDNCVGGTAQICDPLEGAASEVCDGQDNDCDGSVDEGFDVDGDGVSSCGGDCEDNDPLLVQCVEDPTGKVTVKLPETTGGDETTVSVGPCGTPIEGLVFTGEGLCIDVDSNETFVEGGRAEICVRYEEPPPGVNKNKLRLIRVSIEGNPPVTITTLLEPSENTNQAENTICAYTDHFSVFAVGTPTDVDEDGYADLADNCSQVVNPDQTDTDDDGYGNSCDGDFNNDDQTNILDLGLFKQGFGGADPDLDLNGDGAVNILDLGLFKQLFGKPPGPSAFAP